MLSSISEIDIAGVNRVVGKSLVVAQRDGPETPGYQRLCAADGFGGPTGAAPGEHRQPGQQPAFPFGEQLIGPVDRGAQPWSYH